MDNQFDVGCILRKCSNHRIYIRVNNVFEEESNELNYWYELETWSDSSNKWVPSETVAEGYLKTMYERPDRLTLLVKFGESNA